MKVSCAQDALARGLAIVGRAVASRAITPIHSNVLIEARDGQLFLTGTDAQSLRIQTWFDADVAEEGAITVPARLLTDFVNSLPNETVTLTLPARNRQIKVSCARNEASISGLPADDYPESQPIKDGVSARFDPKALRQAITQTVFAAATDDSRPVLTGVDIKLEGSMATLAASDGFRLSVYRLPLEEPVEDATEIVVPARALNELQRLLGRADATRVHRIVDSQGRSVTEVAIDRGKGPLEEVTTLDEPVTEPVTLRVNKARTQVQFRLPKAELTAQLIQGSFPNFSQLIPQTCTSRTIMQVSDFLRETRIASVFARDGSGIVRLVITPGQAMTPGKVVVSAKAEEVGDNQGEIDAAVEGEGVKIAFNGKYLQDVLQALEGGELALETTGPSSQGVFKPVGNDNYVHVIMPMFVQW